MCVHSVCLCGCVHTCVLCVWHVHLCVHACAVRACVHLHVHTCAVYVCVHMCVLCVRLHVHTCAQCVRLCVHTCACAVWLQIVPSLRSCPTRPTGLLGVLPLARGSGTRRWLHTPSRTLCPEPPPASRPPAPSWRTWTFPW